MDEARRAVVLVSGGLDSTTVLAMARAQGYRCYTLSFDYGQRHRAELRAAECVSAAHDDVEHKVVRLNLDTIGGSALTDSSIAVPEREIADATAIGAPAAGSPAIRSSFTAGCRRAPSRSVRPGSECCCWHRSG